MAEIFKYILNSLFILSSVLLCFIVLIQEGKGGGLGGAFGGAGGEAFGHGAGGITKVTGVIAGVLMVSAFGLALIYKG